MEHESFESRRSPTLLNRDFVSIKVDREERPDVDRVYMSFVQSTTGSGGWPMTVFLTPELKPFFGGTYFPPTSKWGRPGFIDLLGEIARVWKDDRRPRRRGGGRAARTSAVGDGAALAGRIRSRRRRRARRAVEQFQMAFDRRHGGFGGAPKFPRPSELLFLLREHARRGGRRPPLLMVTETLRAMALGGMRDHVGGGFHRYSVDAEWRVPHFEKMLYDQAQLVLAYLEAAQATGDDFYATVAEDTLDYVLRDMTDPDGGFYSAEDADSVPPEQAGSPTRTSRGRLLHLERRRDRRAARRGRRHRAPAFRDRAGRQRAAGSAGRVHRAEPALRRASRSRRSRPHRPVGRRRGRGARHGSAQMLFDARGTRPRPHLDDKVLTAWNGLMIAAFARAARVLPDSADGGRVSPRPPSRPASFIRDRLWRAPTSTLLRRYRDGDAAIDGYAEDYAYLIWGLLELFQADGDAAWLEWAIAAAGAAGRALLGREGRRLVQHDRTAIRPCCCG